MALWGTSLIVPTIDNHVIALDIRTGQKRWDIAVAPGGGRLKITGAPIVAAGKVVTKANDKPSNWKNIVERISTSANVPNESKETAHGYKNTISMSKTMNNIAVR